MLFTATKISPNNTFSDWRIAFNDLVTLINLQNGVVQDAWDMANAITVGDSSWSGDPLSIVHGGTGANTASDARLSLGLGTMAVQNANNVTITGGNATLTLLTATNVTTAVLHSLGSLFINPVGGTSFLAYPGSSAVASISTTGVGTFSSLSSNTISPQTATSNLTMRLLSNVYKFSFQDANGIPVASIDSGGNIAAGAFNGTNATLTGNITFNSINGGKITGNTTGTGMLAQPLVLQEGYSQTPSNPGGIQLRNSNGNNGIFIVSGNIITGISDASVSNAVNTKYITGNATTPLTFIEGRNGAVGSGFAFKNKTNTANLVAITNGGGLEVAGDINVATTRTIYADTLASTPAKPVYIYGNGGTVCIYFSSGAAYAPTNKFVLYDNYSSNLAFVVDASSADVTLTGWGTVFGNYRYTGLKICESPLQPLGFFGKAPIARPSTTNDITSVRNALINLGLIS